MSISIDHVLDETRLIEPSMAFRDQAGIASEEEYERLYSESIADPEAFWAEAAKELHWFKPWDRVLNVDDAPFYKWFEGGTTNIAYITPATISVACCSRFQDMAYRTLDAWK
jgi:acetyl-CoA synthetase